MHKKIERAWESGPLKILGYLALALALVGVWGVWHGWRTALQYSDGLFIAAAISGAFSVAGRISASAAISSNLYTGTVTGEPMEKRMQRSYRDLLEVGSFSTQMLVVALVLFGLSVGLAMR